MKEFTEVIGTWKVTYTQRESGWWSIIFTKYNSAGTLSGQPTLAQARNFVRKFISPQHEGVFLSQYPAERPEEQWDIPEEEREAYD